MRGPAAMLAVVAVLAVCAAFTARGAPDELPHRLRAQQREFEAGLRLHAAQLRLLEFRGRDVTDLRTARAEAASAVSNLGERIRSGDFVAAIDEARALAPRIDRMLADADTPISQLHSASAWRIQLPFVAAVLRATLDLAERRIATLSLLGQPVRDAELSVLRARAGIGMIADAVNRDDAAAANAALAAFAELAAGLQRELAAAAP